MKIISFGIRNYKSFLAIDEVVLSPGFNVIVGQNNVGKTALAEAMSLRFGDNPHRSPKTIPYPGAAPEPASIADISFELDRDEFLNLLIDNNSSKFYVHVHPQRSDDDEAQRFLKSISERNTLKCIFQSGSFVSAFLEAYGNDKSDRVNHFKISRDDKRPRKTGNAHLGQEQDTFAFQLANVLRGRIYMFRAERLNVGQFTAGRNPILEPDASNLAQVLNFLMSSNPGLSRKLNQYTSTVFPEITQITVPLTSSSANPNARISIWTTNPDSGRDDLAIPLQESGTGIGQVLAMLYIILTSEYPRVIVIDEPQSFLHPGAIRKLFEIFKQHPQHQYIITTHSPTAVMSANPESLLLVRKEEAESIIEIVDMTETQKLRLYLSEIGARLSDVFGADNILWVEGQTEEQCFPLILSAVAKRPLLGTTILSVIQTGDFKGKHKETILEIYTRLSQGKGLLPPAVGFIFDQEGLTETEREDLCRQSNGAVHFLPRKMYENYLLNPQAIASVMSDIQGFRDSPVTAEEVEKWIEHNKWDTKYVKPEQPQDQGTSEIWVKIVDGAKILEDMFTKLSDTRVNYDNNKIQYGVALTNWLIKNSPTELQELADFIVSVLEQKKEPVQAS